MYSVRQFAKHRSMRLRAQRLRPPPLVGCACKLQLQQLLQRLMLRGRRHARESAGAGFGSDAMRDGVQEGGGRARGLHQIFCRGRWSRVA